jgi:hypothetical protein
MSAVAMIEEENRVREREKERVDDANPLVHKTETFIHSFQHP